MIDDLVHTDFKAVDKRDHVSTLYGWLRGEIDRVPIVCDRDKPYGIVNERAFMRSHISPDAKIEGYVVGTKTVTAEVPVERVFDVISQSQIPFVPVTGEDGKAIKGYVSAADALTRGNVPDDVHVDMVMTEGPVLDQKEAIGEAVHKLRKSQAPVIPIVNGNKRLVGVIRRRDMLGLVTDHRPSGRKPGTGERENLRQPPLEGYVDHNYETVRPGTRLVDAREDLRKFGFLVVTNDEMKPLGIVTPEHAVTVLTER